MSSHCLQQCLILNLAIAYSVRVNHIGRRSRYPKNTHDFEEIGTRYLTCMCFVNWMQEITHCFYFLFQTWWGLCWLINEEAFSCGPSVTDLDLSCYDRVKICSNWHRTSNSTRIVFEPSDLVNELLTLGLNKIERLFVQTQFLRYSYIIYFSATYFARW